MSKLEEKVYKELLKIMPKGLIKEQPDIPIYPPWFKSKRYPKADFLIDDYLYIEVKGFMTIEAMTKMLWFCKQNIPYYVIQIGENQDDWVPSFFLQLEEINYLRIKEANENCLPNLISNRISEDRIFGFIKNRLDKLSYMVRPNWKILIDVDKEKLSPTLLTYTPEGDRWIFKKKTIEESFDAAERYEDIIFKDN